MTSKLLFFWVCLFINLSHLQIHAAEVYQPQQNENNLTSHREKSDELEQDMISKHDQLFNWQAYIDLNAGYNSNYQLLGNQDVASNTNLENDGYYSELMLGSTLRLLDTQNSDLKLLIDYGIKTFSEQTLQSSSFYSSLPYSYYFDNYRLRGIVDYASYSQEGESLLNETGTRIDITRKFGFLHLKGLLQLQKSRAPQETYNYLDNDFRLINLQLKKISHSQIYAIDLNTYSLQYPQNALENHNAWGSSTYALLLHNRKEYLFKVKYHIKNYTSAIDGNINRQDRIWSMAFIPSYFFSKTLNLYLKMEYSVNTSNYSDELEDYNYQRIYALMGIKWFL